MRWQCYMNKLDLCINLIYKIKLIYHYLSKNNDKMNPKPETQLVSHVLNQMEDVMNQTMNEKCADLVKLMKSRNYEAIQTADECRRMWLLCVLDECDKVDQFCVNLGLNIPTTNHSIRKDLSYEKQIFSFSMMMFYRMDAICKKVSNYNGRIKKMWIDCIDNIYHEVEGWNNDSDCEENLSE